MSREERTMASEKVRTRHPEPGKRNQPVDRSSYELFRAAIVAAIRRHQLTHTDLVAQVARRVKGRFSGNVGWHVMTVKLDLEARNIIERSKSKPHRYRLK
jgi:hypothetical protein